MTPLPPVPGPALAPALRARLVAAGYTASGVSALLGPVAERALARGEPTAARRTLCGDGPLETLIRLFLLAEPVSTAAAEGAFGALADEQSLLRPDDEGGLRAAIDIRPYGDDWYVASDLRPPSGAAPLHPEAVVGIGSASVTLASTIPVAATGTAAAGNSVGKTALDLGTGSGVQALHLAAAGAQVTGTDTSRRALEMATLTAALSGVTVELVVGDLYEPVAGRRFDRVVANPPFVIGPTRFTYRDSTLPADGLTERVVRSAADHLHPGGTATLLGSWLAVRGEDWRQRLGGWLPDHCDALVIQRELLDPAEHVALWLADGDAPADAESPGGLAERWLADLEGLDAEGVGYGLVLLRRLEDEDDRPQRTLLDLRDEPSSLDATRLQGWLDRVALLRRVAPRDVRLRPAPDLLLQRTSAADPDGWEPVGATLRAPGALPAQVAVNELVVALVSECDPALPLGGVLDLVAAGTGNPHLATDALPAMLELVEAGLLVPFELSPGGSPVRP